MTTRPTCPSPILSSGSLASTDAVGNFDHLSHVEEENQQFRDKIDLLKRLFQGVQVQPSPNAPTTPVAQTGQRRNSVTSCQLKTDNPEFDLENFKLDHVASRLLVSQVLQVCI